MQTACGTPTGTLAGDVWFSRIEPVVDAAAVRKIYAGHEQGSISPSAGRSVPDAERRLAAGDSVARAVCNRAQSGLRVISKQRFDAHRHGRPVIRVVESVAWRGAEVIACLGDLHGAI